MFYFGPEKYAVKILLTLVNKKFIKRSNYSMFIWSVHLYIDRDYYEQASSDNRMWNNFKHWKQLQ